MASDFPYKSIEELLSKTIANTEPFEEYFNQMKDTIKKGFLTPEELLDICRWKSPRTINKIETDKDKIKILTSKAFSIKCEDVISIRFEKVEGEKIDILDNIKGVGVPMASAILTLTDPENYGVIDIRVWQVLFRLKKVDYDPEGQNFTKKHWTDFLKVIRNLSKEYKTRARDVERVLFYSHYLLQVGNLYETVKEEQEE